MALALCSMLPSSMVSITPGGRAVAEKMPGLGPFGFFDPFGLTPDTKEELMLFREAELAHSRVAMMGALGYLVQSHFAPIFDMEGAPVIRHLDIVLSEIQRARVGWVEPEVEMRTLREGYLPG